VQCLLRSNSLLTALPVGDLSKKEKKEEEGS